MAVLLWQIMKCNVDSLTLLHWLLCWLVGCSVVLVCIQLLLGWVHMLPRYSGTFKGWSAALDSNVHIEVCSMCATDLCDVHGAYGTFLLGRIMKCKCITDLCHAGMIASVALTVCWEVWLWSFALQLISKEPEALPVHLPLSSTFEGLCSS